MTIRRLRARLDRLAPPVQAMLGQDRDRDRRRQRELFCLFDGRTVLEEAEFLALNAFYQEEDRDLGRRGELSHMQFSAEHGRGEALTDGEAHELAELERRYPPDPNHPMKASIEAWGAVADEYYRSIRGRGRSPSA
jgi:hypothetical protein